MQEPWDRSGPVQKPGPSGPRAGFWIRFAALLLDSVLLNVVDLILRDALGNDAGSTIGVLAGIVYFIALVGSPRGQTLGAMALRIRVISLATGGSIGYARSVVRYVVSLFSGLVIFLGYFWMLWDREKQTWHDKAVGSVVVPVASNPIGGSGPTFGS